MKELKLFTDGGCRGNPGPGAIGIVILDEGNNEIQSFKTCIGHTTNNRAEYHALIKGLVLVASHTHGIIHCYLDSELVVNQMVGCWQLKNEELRVLYHEAKHKEQMFRKVIYNHVRRSNPTIQKADKLLNEALDGR